MNPLIDGRELSVRFGSRRVLDGVSLQLQAGEHVALIGPNGAGKTTLLKCLAGLCRRDAGLVELRGKRLESYGAKDLARSVTYVPQQFSAAFRYTVFDFVAMARYPHLGPWSALGPGDRAKIEEALSLTGTIDLSARAVSELSGGEKQLVLLSAALAQGTQVLLLDEPMSGLDPRHQDAVQELLERLQREYQKALITATHELNSAALTAGRIFTLRAGRMLFDAPPGECMNEARLAELYDKSFVLVEHPCRGVAMVLPGLKDRGRP